MPVGTAYMSDNTTVLSNLSLTGSLSIATQLFSMSGVSTSRVTAQFYGLQSSAGTVNLNQGRLLSIRTIAASALTVSAGNQAMSVNEIIFTIGGASGASLAIHSGGTVYVFNSSLSATAI